MVPATRPGVAGAGSAAFFPGDSVLEVTALGGPSARRPRTLPVPYLNEVTELLTRIVSGRLVPVVTVDDRDGLDVHAQVRPAR